MRKENSDLSERCSALEKELEKTKAGAEKRLESTRMEYENRLEELRMQGASKELQVRMKKIEEHLPSSKFMRIHRSFIINLDKVSEVKKNHVMLAGDVSLPIGDNYKDTFISYLNKRILTK